jgi:hypothetical protein
MRFLFLFFFGFLRKIAFDKQHYHKLLLIKKTVILLDAARQNHLTNAANKLNFTGEKKV